MTKKIPVEISFTGLEDVFKGELKGKFTFNADYNMEEIIAFAPIPWWNIVGRIKRWWMVRNITIEFEECDNGNVYEIMKSWVDLANEQKEKK